MEKKDSVWEVGQKVFDAKYGWGVVIGINSDDLPILVEFDDDDRDCEIYMCDGRDYVDDKYPTLSFTNYITDRFSQDAKDATYAQIEPDFDWGCLAAWCNDWIAKDGDGIWYSYNGKPKLSSGVYIPENAFDQIHYDYCPKNSDKIDWEKSLFKNPNK